MIKTFATAVLLGSPAIVSAQSFGVPEGCTGVLTVQHKSCMMINVWQCDADAKGDKWIALIGEGGVFSIQRVDPEFQWLETYKTSGSETLMLPAPDPSSMTELIENGLDTYEFTIAKDSGNETTVGFDTLTGEEVVIDGEPLLRTEFGGSTLDADGTEIEKSAGRQYISTKHRLFFFGEAWDADSPDEIQDSSPVEFIYPGEDGFFAEHPKFECGVVESSYP